MKDNNTILLEEVKKLNREGKFGEIINLLSDNILEQEDNKAELYVWRGYTWHDLKKYDNAFDDYCRALTLDPTYHLAFYNRGLVEVIRGNYDNAIVDFTNAIQNTTVYSDYYYNERANVWKAKGKFKEAINDYTKAIEVNSDLAKAYYGMGLAIKEQLSEKGKDIDVEHIQITLNEIKFYFERYLQLTKDENDIGTKYAKGYIEELNEQIKSPDLWFIGELINKIKRILLINLDFITHYTSLSVLESLVLDNRKFQISEGNCLNDPSEGKEFFSFIYDKPYTRIKNSSPFKAFSPKPFIGSFVDKEMQDNLNMWRFYGKDRGIEAKGCAITIRRHEFIENIKDFLSNEKNREARLNDESDVNLYHVVYVMHNGSNKFHIPKSNMEKKLEGLMEELKTKVSNYKEMNNTVLEKYLNQIAFLFKSDAYKNENEVRLVIKGIEFQKKFNMDMSSPRVYIELVSIKDIVSHITLGPKVDRVSEWIAAFHYRYEKKIPKIKISHLPFK